MMPMARGPTGWKTDGNSIRVHRADLAGLSREHSTGSRTGVQGPRSDRKAHWDGYGELVATRRVASPWPHKARLRGPEATPNFKEMTDMRATTSQPASTPRLEHDVKQIARLLIVSDVAAAEVDDLPASVRAVIESAEEVYVVTPALPGRLAWLANDTDGARHAADERLDSVLGHVRALHAHVNGETSEESAMTAFADAVTAFDPDHILIALRSAEHTDWQERGLIDKMTRKFDLPMTIFDLDRHGHSPNTAASTT
jgi:hypothetical protein